MKYKLLLAAIIFASCGNNKNASVANESSSQVKNVNPQKSNEIVKGRYQCYRLSSAGDEVASDLYILSDNEYKVDNSEGTYSFDENSKKIEWQTGPFHQPTQEWMGIFTKKGQPTGKGGHAVNSLIEVVRKADVEAGNSRVLLRCDCAEKE